MALHPEWFAGSSTDDSAVRFGHKCGECFDWPEDDTVTDEMADVEKVTPILSRRYLERKWAGEKEEHMEKSEPTRVKIKSVRDEGITQKKPHIPESG
jgi:hypothetical protein